MIGLEEIRLAQRRIAASIPVSPCPRSEAFSAMTGNEVYLKLENRQRTGSYKERGALNRILTLDPEERRRGLIAASAGNHAQGVAYHAGRLGLRVEICMPLGTPLTKLMATRGFGADVTLLGARYEEAETEAQRRADSGQLTFIHPFDDDAVIAGQGTVGLELEEQVPQVQVVLVAIGGGGLASGVACALKEKNPAVEVIGVQAARLPSMQRAVETGRRVTVPAATTLAEGIAVRRAGERTLPMVRKYVDTVVTVEEEEIASAVLMLLEREKMLAEGAGAAALAALLHGKTAISGKKVVVVISGGNMDVTLLSRIIERGLVADGRLLRLRVHFPDYPGSLHRLTGVLAGLRTNIVATSYDRAYFGVNFGDTTIDLTLETRGATHIEEVSAALGREGYVFDRIL
jgi:threonine dehydratase